MTSMFPMSETSERQLSLGLWLEESDNAAEIRHLKYIAELERESESALFDWTEGRDAPDAMILWEVFARKSQLLSAALAARLQSRAPG